MNDNEEDYYNYESPFDDEQDWEDIEAQVEFKSLSRIIELQEDPQVVEGNFDAAHLKKVHAHIFQDSAEYMNAGNFREPIGPDHHHAKQRKFYDDDHYMFYAGKPTERSVNKVIKEGFKKLAKATDKQDFSGALADVYAKLDYQHPFDEGNSRTLREFTRLIAKDNGYDLDWGKTNANQFSNIELYVARDSHLIDQNFDFSAKNMMYQKAFNPSLYDQHCEYRRQDMVNYLAEHKKVNGLRDLSEIIESNLVELDQKLDKDLGAEADNELLYGWQKDGAEDPAQTQTQDMGNALKNDVEHGHNEVNMQSEPGINQQSTEPESPAPEQTSRPKRRRP